MTGNILGCKPIIGNKSDNIGYDTIVGLLKQIKNAQGLGGYDFGFDAGFTVYTSDLEQIALQNTPGNTSFKDVIGNKEDTLFGDSIVSKLCSSTGHLIYSNVRVTGTGALTTNLLKVKGAVRILEQYAILEEATTLVNATAVYADVWDGSTATALTKNTAVLSNMPVGSIFTKDLDVTNAYSVYDATDGGFSEVIAVKEMGKPFTVWQKTGGIDTFIRFHLTTTDAPVDFTMLVIFKYVALYNGSHLEFV